MSRYITAAQVCDEYGIGMSTLKRWIGEGRVTYYRVGPKSLRFKPAEVEAQLLTRVGAENIV